ncbi:MAG: hypothetical protein HYT97_03105 [Elusimicrobia bacterium]|nr:hypothetical protein [Elusimicrobiota bacterium]
MNTNKEQSLNTNGEKKKIISIALTHIFNGINQLSDAFPGKAFTIDGRQVGDIVEVIAALE